MDDASPPFIEKNVVLLGAGNAHLGFVRMFGMEPPPGVAATLVSEGPVMPYSAMVPGHIAGEYRQEEITIDLVRLCRLAGVRFVAARARGLDIANRRVLFDDRPEMSYDALSLGVGSSPARPMELADSETSWPMRPLTGLLERLDAVERTLREAPRSFRLAVVGGGASGCELTLAIRKRFTAAADLQVTLLQGNARLVPNFPPKAAKILSDLMREQGIDVRLNARVTGGDGHALKLADGQSVECDAVLWATHAAPTGLLAGSALQLDERGFLLVRDTLQSVSDEAVFGSGDCISIQSRPDLPKNGVYAVRQGAVLFDNVQRFLREQPLARFKPQRRCLVLFNTSDGSAILNYGSLVRRGRWVRRLKERIDRQWIEKFTRLESGTMGQAEPASHDSPRMRCGGCGNKISSDVLSSVLRRIDPGDDPRVILGGQAGEDAAVHRMSPALFIDRERGGDPARLVEVQTVDYFKSFVDDPYLFGRIAALNALSDLYAMNARPFSALAIATLPYARGPVQEAMLHELLAGAVRSLRELGAILTGGHTTEGAELALGFAVTGHADEHALFRKSKLEVGDQLVLTKPLGSGALLAAWMRGQCPATWFAPLIDTMLVANNRAAPILAARGVTACTDVTGFGLGGHLLEMLDASGVSARLHPAAVPRYPGFEEVVRRGIVSTLHADNAKAAGRVHSALPPPAWLFDPQTSGGLLAGLKPGEAAAAVRSLIDAGYTHAAIIGEVTSAGAEEPAILL